MPKGSPELTAARKEEIINACEQLYQTMSFKDITLKEIGNVTSFTITSVSISNREQLLKLLAMNNYDMEANSRPELLTSFKVAYGTSIRNIRRLLQKFCPDMTVGAIQNFIYIFFPFMFGIYPYTAVTDKQREAMKEANVDYVYQSVYEITHTCLCRLLVV